MPDFGDGFRNKVNSTAIKWTVTTTTKLREHSEGEDNISISINLLTRFHLCADTLRYRFDNHVHHQVIIESLIDISGIPLGTVRTRIWRNLGGETARTSFLTAAEADFGLELLGQHGGPKPL